MNRAEISRKLGKGCCRRRRRETKQLRPCPIAELTTPRRDGERRILNCGHVYLKTIAFGRRTDQFAVRVHAGVKDGGCTVALIPTRDACFPPDNELRIAPKSILSRTLRRSLPLNPVHSAPLCKSPITATATLLFCTV